MKWQKSLDPLARTARRTLIGMAALGVVTGKIAADFDLTSSRIVGLAGIGEKQVESWKNSLLDLAPVVGKAPKELAEALYFVSSSGVEASKALDVVDKAARASASGLGETQVVADAVTSAMNAYAGVNMDAARATDVLVATVREGKGEAAEIAPVLGNVVPIAAELGVSFEEVGAAIASMTRLGFDAATAATNLSGVFNALLKPAADSKKALKGVGTSAGEIREMLAKKGLLATLQFLEDRFEGNSAALSRVFRDVRGFRAVLSLVGKSAEGTEGVFKRMEDTTGSLGHAFDAVADQDAFKMQQALAQLQAEGVRLGRDLVPVGVAIAGTFADIVGVLGRHETATKAAAAAVVVFSTAIIGANTALKVYNSQLVASLGLRGVLAGIGAAAGPIGLVAAGLLAGAAAAVIFGDDTTDAENAMRDATTAAREYKTALDELKGAKQDQRDASLAVERAELEVDRARKERKRVMRDEKATTLDQRDAKLRLREAVLALERAEDRASKAAQTTNDTRVRVGIGAKKAREDLVALRQTILDEIDPLRRISIEREKDTDGVRGWGATMREAREDTANFARGARELGESLGGAETPAGRAALAVANLTTMLDRVPTKKEVEVAMETAEAYRQYQQIHDRITTPLYLPVILRPSGTTGVQERAAGGPVMPGGTYVVGEKRPELLVMGRRGGYVHPTVSGGMRAAGGDGGVFEVIFMDWERGRATMRRVAGAEDAAHARVARQRARMGS